jgi:hypothetical protein
MIPGTLIDYGFTPRWVKSQARPVENSIANLFLIGLSLLILYDAFAR